MHTITETMPWTQVYPDGSTITYLIPYTYKVKKNKND